jgi:chromosomal replication initiator protein
VTPDLTFEHFTPTAGTRRAVALARAMVSRSSGGPCLLLLRGPAGVGKTHLLRAILEQVGRERPQARVLFTTAGDVVGGVMAAIRAGDPDADLSGWEGASVIATDDLHVLAGRPVTQREVARRLRRAVAAGSRVVGAAGPSSSSMGALIASLRRDPGLTVAEIGRPSFDEMRRIVVERAGREAPRGEVLSALVASAVGDVRRALGGLNGRRFMRGLRGPAPRGA